MTFDHDIIFVARWFLFADTKVVFETDNINFKVVEQNNPVTGKRLVLNSKEHFYMDNSRFLIDRPGTYAFYPEEFTSSEIISFLKDYKENDMDEVQLQLVYRGTNLEYFYDLEKHIILDSPNNQVPKNYKHEKSKISIIRKIIEENNL